MAVGTRMQQRRGLESEWVASNYILAAGEIGLTLDTGIAKFGDGVNGWNNLPIALENLYLPILGKAADSELLDGVGIESLVKFADTDVDPTADSFVQRTGTGRIKASAGAASDDVATFGQLDVSRYSLISRTVGTASTLALTDSFSTININNTTRDSLINITIPPNADVAFPTGTWIDICSVGTGTALVVAGAGVTLTGDGRVYGNLGSIRIVKTAINTWMVIRRSDPPDAYARCFMYQATQIGGFTAGWKHLPLHAETYDTHNGHKTGPVSGEDTDTNPAHQTNRYYCKPGQAGWYEVHGMFCISTATAVRFQARIVKNGAVFESSISPNMGSDMSGHILTGAKMIPMAENDYISLQGYCNVSNWAAAADLPSGTVSSMAIKRIA